MRLSVFHTPGELPVESTADCAVVIDVLRATSTMAAALDAGAEAIAVFETIGDLLERSGDWPAAERVRLGERGGAMVPGCDLGNSPLEVSAAAVAGRRVFMSTTNGTRCLAALARVPTVITAALTTRSAVVEFLARGGYDTVWLVASGWRGAYALEDTVCAGAIADALLAGDACDPYATAHNDALLAAVSLYRAWRERLAELLQLAQHGRRLVKLGCQDDVLYCAQVDRLDVVPIRIEAGILRRHQPRERVG